MPVTEHVVTEHVSDPEFDLPANWNIAPLSPPIPASTAVAGGQLIAGTFRGLPPRLGYALVTDLHGLAPSAGTTYKATISLDYLTGTGIISYGGVQLWDETDGSVATTVPFVALTADPLLIVAASALFDVYSISITTEVTIILPDPLVYPPDPDPVTPESSEIIYYDADKYVRKGTGNKGKPYRR